MYASDLATNSRFRRAARRGAATALGALLLAALMLAMPASARAAAADAGSDETTALGRPVTLDGSGSLALPPATYTWDVGDGEATSSATPIAAHNYRFCGSYVATLTVTDIAGSSTDTAAVSIDMSATNIDYSKFPPDRDNYFAETPSTRYVALSGSDADPGTKARPYATIQHALSQAASGTVILVRGGHYFTGDITVQTSGIVLAAYPGEKVVLETDRYGAWEHRNGITLAGPLQNVVLDGLEIRHFTTMGVQFGDEDRQRSIVLKNLVIEDADEGITTAYSDSTPTMPFIDGLLVRNTALQHIRGIGFNAGQYGGGLELYRNVRLKGLYCLMTGTGNDTASDAVAFENGDNVLAEDCIADGARGDGFDFKANHAAVVNSIARRVARNGVKLWRNGQIINSLCYDTAADAGVVLEEGDFRIVNSVLAWHLKGRQGGAYCMTAGYGNSSFGSLELFRSIVYEQCDRFYVEDTGPGSLSVRDNVFWRFARNRILEYGGTDYETTATINVQPWGDANVERDPGFANPADDDWHIAGGSNGFVAPEVTPQPVVTITSPGYRDPVGPRKSLGFRSDQNATYSLEVTTNAVRGSGVVVRSGTVQKHASHGVGIPATVRTGSRVYLFLTNAAGESGWEWRPVDAYRPRTYAPRYAIVRRYRPGRLYYKILDPYSSRAHVTIAIRNRRGRYVAKLRVGWRSTGSLHYRGIRPRLARGRYAFLIYARDLANNTQRWVAKNALVVR